jgi:hypothetical protein
MRARTIHSTSGRVGRSLGFFDPHPPEGMELSTGTPRRPAVVGVAVPGVAGGVKEGESSDGGGSRPIGVSGSGWAETEAEAGVEGAGESDNESMDCSSDWPWASLCEDVDASAASALGE